MHSVTQIWAFLCIHSKCMGLEHLPDRPLLTMMQICSTPHLFDARLNGLYGQHKSSSKDGCVPVPFAFRLQSGIVMSPLFSSRILWTRSSTAASLWRHLWTTSTGVCMTVASTRKLQQFQRSLQVQQWLGVRAAISLDLALVASVWPVRTAVWRSSLIG